MTIVGTIRELWRYPVKSMRGERCERLWLDQRGVVGDRLYAVRDEAGKFGSGKTTRRFRRIDGLLAFSAAYEGEVPLLTFPDGVTLRGDNPAIHAALSAQLGLPVTLSREAEIPHFDASALHLLTTASIRTLHESLVNATIDERRFRPNIFVDVDASEFPEDAWQGHDIAVGSEARIRVERQTERCVMVGMAQDNLPDDPRILRAVARLNAACLGVYANVITPGVINVGDTIRLL